MNLIYRPQYLEDVAECADYLTTEAGEEVAAAWYAALKAALLDLQKTPELGRLRTDLPMEGIRSLNLRKYPNYLLFYRLENNRLELLRIKHGMMNLTALFSE